MTLGEIKKRVAMLINTYSERGEIFDNNATNVKDFYLKMNGYIDMAQKSISEIKYVKKNKKITHIVPFNPTSEQFEILTHYSEDIIICASEAHAYSFCVDGDAEVFIEGVKEDGSIDILSSIFPYSDDGGFKRFKDLIYIPEDEQYKSIQLRFSGDYYYNIKNTALFNAKYSTYDKIPDFARYIEYIMPDDFYKIISIKIRDDNGLELLKDFYWKNPNILAVSVYEKGEIIVEYAIKPKTIDADTAEDYELEIGETAQVALAYYVAALLVQKEDYNLYTILMQNYTERMVNISNSIGLSGSRIKKVY